MFRADVLPPVRRGELHLYRVRPVDGRSNAGQLHRDNHNPFGLFHHDFFGVYRGLYLVLPPVARLGAANQRLFVKLPV